MKSKLLMVCLIVALTCNVDAVAQSGLVDGSLGRWLIEEASPQFSELLNKHPRFRRQRIRITGLRDGRPFPITDRLSERIKQQLTQDLLRSADVQLVYDENRSCQPENTSTVLGIEIQRIKHATYRVVLAMVDTDEGIWLSGTNKVWQGRLDQSQTTLVKSAVRSPAAAELPVEHTNEVVKALQAQLKCYPGIATPILFSIGDHPALRDIGFSLKQFISQRSLVTSDLSDATSILAVRVDKENHIYIELAAVEDPANRSRIASVSVSGLSRPQVRVLRQPVKAQSFKHPAGLLSELQLSDDRDGVCDRRSQTCINVDFRLKQAAYLVPFYTREGMAEVVNCSLAKRGRTGPQRYGINVAASNGTRVGFYALAFKQRSDARTVHDQLKQASVRCGGRSRSDVPVTSILGSHLGEFDWTAIHLLRQFDSVRVL